MEHEKFHNARKNINNPGNKVLRRFTFVCFLPTAFEVRYTNGSLCACGKARRKSVYCKKKLPLNFIVYISATGKRFRKWSCIFTFHYQDRRDPKKITLTINQKKISTPVLDELSSLAGMPALTTSQIGQVRGESSKVNNQFISRNSVTYSSQIR